jgi:serine protease
VTGIRAAGNNWSGMAGVSWKTRILPVRVLGKCGGSVSTSSTACCGPSA